MTRVGSQRYSKKKKVKYPPSPKTFKIKGLDPKERYIFRQQKYFAHNAVFEEVCVNFDLGFVYYITFLYSIYRNTNKLAVILHVVECTVMMEVADSSETSVHINQHYTATQPSKP